MNKTQARTCYGCKAIMSKSRDGCAFGFSNTAKRVAGTITEIKERKSAEPCFRVTTQKAFNEVAQYIDVREVA